MKLSLMKILFFISFQISLCEKSSCYYGFINDTPYEVTAHHIIIPPYSKYESEKFVAFVKVTFKNKSGKVIFTMHLLRNGSKVIARIRQNKIYVIHWKCMPQSQIIEEVKDGKIVRKQKWIDRFADYWKKHGKAIEAAPKDGTLRQPTP